VKKWDVDTHTSNRSLTLPAGNLSNKPAARNDHTTQPETGPAFNRFALKPLALALLVPPGYTDPAVYAAGGNPYGTSFVNASPSGGLPDPATLSAARHQGRRLAQVTIQLLAGSRASVGTADENGRAAKAATALHTA
jgi:hypothetical protein